MPVLIRVNVSRKLTRDYNSRGFGLEVQQELPASAADDPQQMAQASDYLFQLASDLLDEQVGRAADADGGSANGNSRHATYAHQTAAANGNGGHPTNRTNGNATTYARGNGRTQAAPRNGDSRSGSNGKGGRPITAAQLRALNNMSKRLDTTADRIAQEDYGVADASHLTLQQASEAIDRLKQSIEAIAS